MRILSRARRGLQQLTLWGKGEVTLFIVLTDTLTRGARPNPVIECN